MSIQNALSYSTPNKKIIGLLFSADYCKYCHIFVPSLRKFYPHLQKHDIEIVFVASDKTKEAFTKYLVEHPWPHVDYDDNVRMELRQMYTIKTIPALLFFDTEGNLLEREGRNLIVDTLEKEQDLEVAASNVALHLGLGVDYDSDNSDF